MKAVKLLGHPLTVVILFLLLLISGESFGGFYLLYLLMALPHGGLHALLGVGGLLCMLTGYNISPYRGSFAKPGLYIAGLGLMIFSLLVFFQKSNGYNDSTFEQVVPIISFCLFALCVFFNLLMAASLILKAKRKDSLGTVS